MAIEIERRFLVRADGWRAAADAGTPIQQGYLTPPGGSGPTLRVRLSGEKAWLTVKSKRTGAARHEFEYPIPAADARNIAEGLCPGGCLQKTRFRVPAGGGLTWEVDVFGGENEGLVLAEIELPAEDAEFDQPEWLGEEITDDDRYSNAALAAHPVGRW